MLSCFASLRCRCKGSFGPIFLSGSGGFKVVALSVGEWWTMATISVAMNQPVPTRQQARTVISAILQQEYRFVLKVVPLAAGYQVHGACWLYQDGRVRCVGLNDLVAKVVLV